MPTSSGFGVVSRGADRLTALFSHKTWGCCKVCARLQEPLAPLLVCVYTTHNCLHAITVCAQKPNTTVPSVKAVRGFGQPTGVGDSTGHTPGWVLTPFPNSLTVKAPLLLDVN